MYRDVPLTIPNDPTLCGTDLVDRVDIALLYDPFRCR